jgi:replicative DNA helicase
MSEFDSQRKAQSAPPKLPHNIEAEQALLGALLFDNEVLSRVRDLTPESFYDPVHGRIFAMIRDMIRSGSVADGVALKERAAKDDGLQEIGGALYLMRLLELAAPLSTQARAYADIIHEMAVRRAMYQAAMEAAALALDPPEGASIADVLIDAQRGLSAVGETDEALGEEWKSAGEIAAAAVERAYTGDSRGISTGLPSLDDCTGGGRPGTLWVLAGATSMGKSVGGQQFAVNVARQDYGVAYIHLEMDRDEVGLRLASALAFDWKRINATGESANPAYLAAANQRLKPDQWERMRDATRTIAPQLKIFVDDRPGRTVTQIEAACRRLFQRMKREGVTPGLIVIDHEGLIAPEGKHPSELEAARARAHKIKDMAKRLGVWTIALSQITKEGSRADGEDRLPQATDLNYGSALSQAAHVVILLHRKGYYEERKPRHQGAPYPVPMDYSTTLVVDKARGGMRKQISAIMRIESAVLAESKDAT